MQLVEWTKGFEQLTVGEWVPLGKKSKARVDVLGSLLIENADREAEGQYVCRSSHTSYHFLVFVQQRSILTSPGKRSTASACDFTALCHTLDFCVSPVA
jgi:hypothetical protein